jgi:1-deoxy-D-xylulose-5-phosphate reductoisomerase
MAAATPEQALRHPNWAMGARITVDSASMVNKALEIIEAGHLFGMSAGEIGVLIHPSSIIHSMVQYPDGAVLAQMGAPDMRVPILYALAYPGRLETGLPPPRLTGAPLVLEEPDFERFPALGLGYQVLKEGGVSGAVFNAADEVAVQGFLDGKCGFLDIAALCEDALAAVQQVANPSLEELYQADEAARAYVLDRLSGMAGK